MSDLTLGPGACPPAVTHRPSPVVSCCVTASYAHFWLAASGVAHFCSATVLSADTVAHSDPMPETRLPLLASVQSSFGKGLAGVTWPHGLAGLVQPCGARGERAEGRGRARSQQPVVQT